MVRTANVAQGNNIFTLGNQFDTAMSALLADLKSSGQLASTMVIAMGEFGRTPYITGGGRDATIILNQFAMFAGGGVKGGKVIGATNADGSADHRSTDGRRSAPVNPEDIEATIYSAMGINWTNVCYNDPFHRGFEYVPQIEWAGLLGSDQRTVRVVETSGLSAQPSQVAARSERHCPT